MKVIVASFSKCGTKTLHKCLETLGYNVFDFDSHLYLHTNEWEKILTKGSTKEQFRRMYENVDAVCDLPAYCYWEEIHEAFPDAKIILTMRKNEDEWMRSLDNQWKLEEDSMMFFLERRITWTGRKIQKIYDLLGPVLLSCPPQSIFAWMRQPNPQLKKKSYRNHNNAVMQKAPKDKLLVFDLADGWKPMCDFLNKDVPDIPFPHENIKGESIAMLMSDIPLFVRLRQELYCSLFVLTIGTALLVYFMWTYFL